MKLLLHHTFNRSDWSGGQTTEMLILPNNSLFNERDFSLRISSALVRDMQSDFTVLPGYERLIIPLTGILKMKHMLPTGVLEQELQPFQLGRFKGDWKTTAENESGLVDFNVMFDELKVEVQLNFLHPSSVVDFNFNNYSNCFIWLFQGTIQIEEQEIKEGIAVVYQNSSPIKVKAVTDFKAIVVQWNQL